MFLCTSCKILDLLGIYPKTSLTLLENSVSDSTHLSFLATSCACFHIDSSRQFSLSIT